MAHGDVALSNRYVNYSEDHVQKAFKRAQDKKLFRENRGQSKVDDTLQCGSSYHRLQMVADTSLELFVTGDEVRDNEEKTSREDRRKKCSTIKHMQLSPEQDALWHNKSMNPAHPRTTSAEAWHGMNDSPAVRV